MFVILSLSLTVPSAPVQNITLSSVTSTGLTVSWSAPPLSHQNGDILLYNILVSAVNSAYQQLVTSSDMMTQINGLHPDTLYTIMVTPETSMGPGVASSLVEFSTMESGELINVFTKFFDIKIIQFLGIITVESVNNDHPILQLK